MSSGKFRVRKEVMVRFLKDHCRVNGDSSGHQVRIDRCPVCGDEPASWGDHGNAFRHVVNFRKQIFFCYRQDCLVDLVELVRLLGGFRTMAGAMQFLASFGDAFDLTGGGEDGLPIDGEPDHSPVLTRIRNKLAAVSTPSVEELHSAEMELPESFSCDWNTKMGRAALSYARRRKCPQWFIDSGRVGYCSTGEMKNRLVFLVFEGPRLVYFVGRTMSEYRSPKYLFPNAGGSLGKSSYVFNLDVWAGVDRLVVCEGTVSALAVDGGVSVFGHRMSPIQAGKIARVARDSGIQEVVLLFDPDLNPAKEAQAASLLSTQGCPNVKLGLLEGGDPAEVPHEVPGAVENAMDTGDRISLLKARAGWLKKK